MIVDTDCRSRPSIPAIVYSAFGYAGQKCSALSRLIVMKEVASTLSRERLVGAVNELKIGEPNDMGVDVGPVIDERCVSSGLRA